MQDRGRKAATERRQSKPYPIVAIGASAGGLEAVSELLENLSPRTGMAFIYVQHLDPTHESKLADILQRKTKMKVVEARHLMPLEPNHVFIIPPNKSLVVIDGVLALNDRMPKPAIHLPIDTFFSSLAEKQNIGAIGILLSGNASDGTEGLKDIKLAGGLTFAQGASAKFQSMPQSAINAGYVDLVLSPKEMAVELERISQHPATAAIVEPEDKETAYQIADNDVNLVGILQLLRKATGVDFTHYKLSTIKRRILRRVLIYRLDDLEQYFLYLKAHPGETQVLYQELLISVTRFFRDADTMEYVKKTVVPQLLKSRPPNEGIRVWVPACATGEEAYSLAMIFMEVMADQMHGLQIFASDLSEVSIAKARTGLYAESELENVSEERRKRFFDRIDGGYRIVKPIRDLCVFATHNILRDPPFSRLDLISCCNLMIYLDTVLQKKLLVIFHYALRKSGYLILGSSETVSAAPEFFLQAEKKFKVFTRRTETAAQALFDMQYRTPEIAVPAPAHQAAVKIRPPESDVEKAAQAILLKDFVPACVVINRQMEILMSNGSTGLYLELSQGKASLNLLKMARPGLTYELRNAVHKAEKSGERIKRVGLEMKVKDQLHRVSIEVVPITADEDTLFLVVFEEQPLLPEGAEGMLPATRDELVKRLEAELVAAKEDMHSIIEEQEAAVEELQSANEEIISSNEELQSINEELETAKEEVESSNEELMTINHELQVRNEQLSASYEYSQAIIDTIDEAVLVLDRELKVRSANAAFYRMFHETAIHTEGVILYDLGNKQWNIPELRELLGTLVNQNQPFKGFELEHEFPFIGKKTMVLNARLIYQKERRQQLIIVAIRDVSAEREGAKIIARQEERFRNMANNAPVMIWTRGLDKTCQFVNKTMLDFTGRTLEDELGMGWANTIHAEDLGAYLELYSSHFKSTAAFKASYRLLRKDGQYRWINEQANPQFSNTGSFTGYIGSCVDIHDQKLVQEEMEKMVELRTRELKDAIEDLGQSNTELGQFAYVASHDLQEPLRKIITFSDRLIESKREKTAEERQYLERIASCAERMRTLINDLLNFSRASKAGKDFATVDLNQVVSDVLKDLDLLIEEKKAKVQTGNLPAISGNAVQLHQLFYNLIGNALKFSSEERKPKIQVRARKTKATDLERYPFFDRNGTYYEITVADNGIGFPPEFADQIFTIFQRLNDDEKYPGSGIGLALCRKIVLNHKGFIYGTSEEGAGAKFHIIIPEKLL